MNLPSRELRERIQDGGREHKHKPLTKGIVTQSWASYVRCGGRGKEATQRSLIYPASCTHARVASTED